MDTTTTGKARPIRVLSIDGGGIRGLIPAMVLERVEAVTGRPIARLFDVIVGTSTGGVMTLLLATPGPGGAPRYRAADIAGLYVEHGRDLFCKRPDRSQDSPAGTYPKYPAECVTRTLGTYFGDVTLRQALTGVIVSAYDIESSRPAYFQYPLDDADPDYYMRDLGQATSAFPGLFPPAEITSVDGRTTRRLIDGGVMSANPAALAAARARPAAASMGQKFWAALSIFGFGRTIGDLWRASRLRAPIWLVSLGTGVCEAPLPWPEARSWGFQQWVGRGQLVEAMFSGASDSSSMEASMWPDLTFQRMQMRLPAALQSTDDASEANVAALQAAVNAEFSGPARLESPLDGFGDWPGRLQRIVDGLREMAGAEPPPAG